MRKLKVLLGFFFLLYSWMLTAQSFKPVVQNGHAIQYPQNPLIYSLVFSDDGKKILTTGQDGSAILWEVETGRQIISFNNGYEQSVYASDISADNSKIALFNDFCPVQVFDVNKGILEGSYYEGERVWKEISYRGGAFMFDDKLVATPWGFQVYELGQQKPMSEHTMHGSNNYIMKVSRTTDRKFLGVATRDYKTLFFSYPEFKNIGEFSNQELPLGIRFSNDGKFAGTVTEDEVFIYEHSDGKFFEESKRLMQNANDIAFSNDGSEYFVATKRGLEVYSMKDHKKRMTVNDYAHKVATSPNGEIVAIGNNQPNEQIKLYTYPDFLPLRSFKVNNLRNYTAISSPSGRYLAVGMKDRMILWDLKKGVVMLVSFKSDFYLDFAFSKDETILYAKSESILYKYKLDGKLLNKIVLRGNAIALSEDETTLKVLCPENVWHLVQTEGFNILETNKHKIMTSAVYEYYNRSVISSNGEYAAVFDTDFKVFNISSGKTLLSQKYDYSIMARTTALGIDPKGNYLALGKNIYDLNKKKILIQLPYRANNLLSSLEFSHDGMQLFVGTTSGELVIYETTTWKEIHREKVSNSPLKKIHVNQNTNQLFLCSMDGKVVCFDRNQMALKATLIASTLDEYVVTLSSGHYRTSRSDLSSIHFSNKGQTFGLESFDLAYNRPDLVISALGIADEKLVESYKRAWVKRVNKMGFSPEAIGMDIHLPEVQIQNELPITTQDNFLSIDLRAADSKYTLDRLNVHINNIPIYGKKGLSIRDAKVQTIDKTISIELSQGANRIKISVMNDQGVESIADEHNIVCHASFLQPKNYVVSIGISDYKDNDYDLNYAAKDANDIAAKFGTDPSKVFKITDGNATKEKILAIKSELVKSNVNDRVILFVAGHGLLDDKLNYYIGTHDVNFENPSIRGLAYEDLEGLLDGIPARQKLMFIDACHSGEVDKDDAMLVASNKTSFGTINARGFKKVASKSKTLGLENSFQLMQELFADLRKGTGAVVISSASGAEYALESDAWKNGVFTYAILEGLKNRKCDTDQDGAVQVSELKDYVFDRVSDLTNGQQNPTSRRENLEFDFTVW